MGLTVSTDLPVVKMSQAFNALGWQVRTIDGDTVYVECKGKEYKLVNFEDKCDDNREETR